MRRLIATAAAVLVLTVPVGPGVAFADAASGTVVGWGDNTYGQATPPADLTCVTAIAAGGYSNYALKCDGTVVGWGNTAFGQLDIPAGLGDVIAIAAAVNHAMALKSDGTVIAWGDNTYGQATPPAGLTNVIAIAQVSTFSLAIRCDSTVVGWGDNLYGQLDVPPGLTGAVALAAGTEPTQLRPYSGAIMADGSVVIWGAGNNVPAGLAGVIAWAGGRAHSLALVASDTTPPVITRTYTGTPGLDRWWTSDVSLAWHVSDPESAATTTGCTDVVITADQGPSSHSCTATSLGGTSEVTVSIKRDATPPDVSVTGVTDGATYVLGAVPPAGCTTADATSGVAAAATLQSAYPGGVRSFTATCSGAADNAGNAGGATVSYTVGYAFSGFAAPIDNEGVLNVAKSGRTIPLKWRITDAGGDPVTTLTSVSVKAVGLDCGLGTTTDAVEEYAAGASGLQDHGNGEYQWNWATPAGYAGSCKTLELDLGDTVVRAAAFKFTR